MAIELRELKIKDLSKASAFAVKGMHFEKYTQNETLLKLYGRYFVYMEMERATQIIAAYDGEELAGVLMATVDGEKKKYHSFMRNLYVKIIGFVMDHLLGGAVSPYDDANGRMLSEYRRHEATDGEICFLAADPDIQGKGTGSKLLAELERRENGKKIYLFTDNNCTWQFYEHKGFKRVGEEEIDMDIAGNDVPLRCLLYAKTMYSQTPEIR